MQGTKRPDPFYLSAEWRELRLYVLRRDRWRCVLCSAKVHTKGSARIDHIVERKADPAKARDPKNLRTLCARCDNQRHAEKGRRVQDFGATQTGQPRDPAHWWNRAPDVRAKAAGDDTGGTSGGG